MPLIKAIEMVVKARSVSHRFVSRRSSSLSEAKISRFTSLCDILVDVLQS